MWGEDTIFERQIWDFEAIEKDENKNVDERELIEREDFVDKFNTAYLAEIESGKERDDAIRDALDIASEGAFSRSDEAEQKRWFEKFSKFIEDSIEPETNEKEVKEDTYRPEEDLLPKEVAQQLLDAWELIGSMDDDPHVRTMADEKAEELHSLITSAEQPSTGEGELGYKGGGPFRMKSESEVKEEEVDEQLTPHSDDVLYIAPLSIGEGWSVFKTREGSNQATQIFIFVSEEAAADAASKIADAVGGVYKGKEDPRVDPGHGALSATPGEEDLE